MHEREILEILTSSKSDEKKVQKFLPTTFYTFNKDTTLDMYWWGDIVRILLRWYQYTQTFICLHPFAEYMHFRAQYVTCNCSLKRLLFPFTFKFLEKMLRMYTEYWSRSVTNQVVASLILVENILYIMVTLLILSSPLQGFNACR